MNLHLLIKRRELATAPGPKGHFLWGNLLDVRRDRLAFVSSITKEYGDIVCFRMAHKVMHLVNHPDHARHVLVDNMPNYQKGLGLSHAKSLLGNGLLTSEGDFWHRQKKLILPTFHRENFSGFYNAMQQEIRLMLKSWHDPRRVNPIDVYTEMKKLTLALLSRTLFNIDLSNHNDELTQTFSFSVKEAIHRMSAMFEVSSYVPTPHNIKFKKALKNLDWIVYDLIHQRRHLQTQDTNPDFLSMLLSARDENTGERMSDRQIRDEVVTMLLAGHETTAIAITWSIYLLAKFPDIQIKLRSEASAFGASIHTDYNKLANLSYGRMVLQEAMRLYPPVWLIPRKAIKSDNIGGYHIPSRSEVLICVYTLHRHRSFWNEPDYFMPERFASSQKHHKHAYLPFGAGPRTCIGNHFGLMEAHLALTMIASEFGFKLHPDHPDVMPDPLLTLRPARPIIIDLFN